MTHRCPNCAAIVGRYKAKMWKQKEKRKKENYIIWIFSQSDKTNTYQDSPSKWRCTKPTKYKYRVQNLVYQHDTKVLIKGQMSVCKFFLSFCLPLFRNFAQQEKEALWQTSSFAVFRFSNFLPRSQNERQHDKVCSLSFGWFCREWK